MMEEELHLTELIDVDTLQQIQDAFTDMSGMFALTVDQYGVPVTVRSNDTDFCMKYTRQSEKGCRMCDDCIRILSEMAVEREKICTFTCFTGLTNFVAPIMANGQVIGCFLGGQLFTEEPDWNKISSLAQELGIDPEEYTEAAKKIEIVDKEKLEKASRFLHTTSDILSDMAYREHIMYIGSREAEAVSRMKTDFLANMSHEIRTPMNAVIGMAEMALREEMTQEARDYIKQIKTSGQTLLAIINDILDFSKIESGKMDIIEDVYEPMSLVNDMVNIIMTRIGKKDVEFILDIPADLPLELYGDMTRLKQVIVNLINNAVKFTEHGQVRLEIKYEYLKDDMVELRVAVEDTGHGIKPQDMSRIFQSFQQVDSKRNRNIEGTGLGLAICKQLLALMGGKISVKSEYGKGSIFSFTLPQHIVNTEPSILPVEKETHALLLVANRYVKEQLKKDMRQLGADYYWLSTEKELENREIPDNCYLFVEQILFTAYVQDFLKSHDNLIGVLMVSFYSAMQYAISNLRVVKKPLYPLNLAPVLGGELVLDDNSDENDEFGFIAPEAEILIVDDNAINLTVAQGLLEPLQMKIDTALSGKEAISRVSQKLYDIIFMDHMMPEVDGVETTHIIRRFYEEYEEVPIIALTANAVSGTKEFFLSEGMNDFVAKPIEVKVIVSKIKHWLAPEKIKKNRGEDIRPQNRQSKDETAVEIQGLDTKAALELLGNEKLFWAVLGDYYRVIDQKCEAIKRYETEERWKDYTIEVHALKSASRQIGAMELSRQAEHMESAGNNEDAEQIHACTDEMLAKYRWHQEILKPYFVEEEKKLGDRKMTGDVLAELFQSMQDAMEELDSDAMETVIQEIEQYAFDERQRGLLDRLRGAVEDIDTEECEAVIEEWKQLW